MSLLKTALIIGGVTAGGIVIAKYAGAVLNPGAQKTIDPGLLPANTGSSSGSGGSSSAEVTKRDRLQQLKTDLSKQQTLLDDAKTRLGNLQSNATSICNPLLNGIPTPYLGAVRGKVMPPCEAYARGDASNPGDAAKLATWPPVGKAANANRSKVAAAKADVKKYKANVANIQSQIDQLNAQGVY